MAQSCRKAVLTITSLQAGWAEVDNFWECALCFSVVLCESLKNDTGVLWKGHCLRWKLEGGCCTGWEFPGASFSLQCIWYLPVFVPTSNSSVCLCSGTQNTWLCVDPKRMEFVHGASNGGTLTGSEVFPCPRSVLPTLWCTFCWDMQPAGCRAYFRVQESILSSDSMRGACHGSIPTWNMFGNYCNTALLQSMISISLGLPFHLLHFLLAVGLVDKIFVIKLKCSIYFFGSLWDIA